MPVSKKVTAQIIKEIESKNEAEKALIGIFETGDPGECYLRANREGLELLAAKLLKQSLEAETRFKKNKYHIGLTFDEPWWDEHSHLYVAFVEFSKETGKNSKPLDKKLTRKEKLSNILVTSAVFGVLIFLLIAMIVGVIVILKAVISFVF